MRDETQKYKTFTRRAFFLGGMQFLFFSILAGHYFRLQHVSGSKYIELSERNRLRVMVINPPRGRIFEANGDIITDNRSSFDIGVDTYSVSRAREIINSLQSHINIKIDVSDSTLKKKIGLRPANEYLIIKEDLSWSEISKIVENDHLVKNIEIIKSSVRYYPKGEVFAHITGYVSLQNKKDIKTSDKQFTNSYKVGKAGIERKLNYELSGEAGLNKTEVDVRGKFIRSIENSDVISGQDYMITIDGRLQEYVHNLLTENNLIASVIVLNAQTGEVLAMHSTPSYNPNKFVLGINGNEWLKLLNTDGAPLINKCISNAYPPGSTFKLITSLAGLMTHGFNPNEKFNCTGVYNYGNSRFRCWKESGHGSLDMVQALEQSCNPYFYNLGVKVGIKAIEKAAHILGIGMPTGVEIFGETNGIMPNDNWKKVNIGSSWYPGDTINTAIGQGYTLLTPIQIAKMTAIIASNNKIDISILPNIDNDISRHDIDFSIIRKGMFNCLNKPSGLLYHRGISMPGFEVCGKTGTAQVISLKNKTKKSAHKNHALFTSFAPYNNPKYVVTIVQEHGEAGSNAAGYAKFIYQKILDLGI